MRLDWIRRGAAIACVLSGLVALGGTAEAQRYVRRGGYRHHHGHGRVGVAFVPYGLYVGAGLVGTKVLDQNGGPELLGDGGGLTLFAGLRLGQLLALEAGWVGTFHNPETVQTNFGPDTDYLVLSGFTADAKIFLGQPGQQIDPYLQAGLGLYLLDSTFFGTQSTGTGFQAGGGIDIHLLPFLDLGGRVLYRGIAMGPPDSTQNDTFISALTGEANLALHF